MVVIKIQLESLKMNPFKYVWLDVRRDCFQDTNFKGFGALHGCTSGTSKSFLTKETLNIFDESRSAVERKTRQYWVLNHETVCAAPKDKKAQVCGFCEVLESHLWSINCRRAYREICTLRSSRPPPLLFYSESG